MEAINFMSVLRFSKGKLLPSVNFCFTTMFSEHCENQEYFSVVSVQWQCEPYSLCEQRTVALRALDIFQRHLFGKTFCWNI